MLNNVTDRPGRKTFLMLMLLFPVAVTVTDMCPVTPEYFEEAPPVTAAIGSDVILPCVSKVNIDVKDLILEWRKDQYDIYVFLEQTASFPQVGYNNRTSVFTEELNNNNVSLKLSGVKQTDAGQFCCCIRYNGSRSNCTNVTLNVTDTNGNLNGLTDTKEVRKNESENKDTEGPSFHQLVAVMAGVFLVVCSGLVAGSYVLWKRRNGHQDETQTNTEAKWDRAEKTPLTVVAISNRENKDSSS